MNEYPKSLYLVGWEDVTQSVVVFNADEEKQARALGYKAMDELNKKAKKPAEE